MLGQQARGQARTSTALGSDDEGAADGELTVTGASTPPPLPTTAFGAQYPHAFQRLSL